MGVFTAYENEAIGIGSVWTRVVESLRECCDRAAFHACESRPRFCPLKRSHSRATIPDQYIG